MMQQLLRLRSRLTIVSAFAVTFAVQAAAQSTLPDRYADSTFWRIMKEFSEPNGYFRSDNLLSNETSFQWVVPALRKMQRSDVVYLGVAPEQNFTFIAGLKPKVAFILDIRRGNLLEHLMYKSLFEMSANRVDFTFNLFGRPKPASLAATVGVEELFATIATTALDTTFARKTLNEIKDRLVKGHHFDLSTQDLEYIDYVYVSLSGFGPNVRYNMNGGGGGGGGFRGGGFGGMPSYGALMTETDSLGAHSSYLSTDEAYKTIKDMEERNAIIPFTGDFAGPKALRAFGKYVRDNKATVAAIYVSNVEQYLWMDANNPKLYYDNVATLPIDSTTVFIRSASNGYVRQQSANSRQNELLCPVMEHLKQFNEGKIRSYYDVFTVCR